MSKPIDKCPACRGTGRDPLSLVHMPCMSCGGTGSKNLRDLMREASQENAEPECKS